MTRFNKTATVPLVENRAGGLAYAESPKLAIASLLVTSFTNDQFYRSADQTFDELRGMVAANPLFAAKAAVFARREFGMRSITHVAAVEIARSARGERWVRPFIEAVVHRPDDITEILAYQMGTYGKPIPNALKDGLARAFGKFDRFSLSRYKASDKGLSLVDAVNLVHPKQSERNAGALSDLVKGLLKDEDAWEARLAAAGTEGRGDAWRALVAEDGIGYFALLRNLRNLMEHAPDTLPVVLERLTDASRIRKSLVLPFRFQTALDQIAELPNSRKVVTALEKALDTSLANVPRFDGSTLVALDVSGSMNGKPLNIGSLFAAVLYKACADADLMRFAEDARLVTGVSPNDTVNTIANVLRSANRGGTNFHSIFTNARRKYDRIVILSDMQGWIGYHTPAETFKAYRKQYQADPKVYSFDLAGQGTLQFPEGNVTAMAGFSEKVFDVMALLEQDRDAFVRRIEAVEWSRAG